MLTTNIRKDDFYGVDGRPSVAVQEARAEVRFDSLKDGVVIRGAYRCEPAPGPYVIGWEKPRSKISVGS